MDDPHFWQLALAVAAPLCFYFGFRNWRLARLIDDTPRSRIRSAAQGYVELAGAARPLARAAEPGAADATAVRLVAVQDRAPHRVGPQSRVGPRSTRAAASPHSASRTIPAPASSIPTAPMCGRAARPPGGARRHGRSLRARATGSSHSTAAITVTPSTASTSRQRSASSASFAPSAASRPATSTGEVRESAVWMEAGPAGVAAALRCRPRWDPEPGGVGAGAHARAPTGRAASSRAADARVEHRRAARGSPAIPGCGLRPQDPGATLPLGRRGRCWRVAFMHRR